MPDFCGDKYIENNGPDFHRFKKSWPGMEDAFQTGEGLGNAESAAIHLLSSMHGNMPPSKPSLTPAIVVQNEAINTLNCTIFSVYSSSMLYLGPHTEAY